MNRLAVSFLAQPLQSNLSCYNDTQNVHPALEFAQMLWQWKTALKMKSVLFFLLKYAEKQVLKSDK